MTYADLIALVFVISLAIGLWGFYPRTKETGCDRSGHATYARFSHSQGFIWLLSSLGWALFSTLAFVTVVL